MSLLEILLCIILAPIALFVIYMTLRVIFVFVRALQRGGGVPMSFGKFTMNDLSPNDPPEDDTPDDLLLEARTSLYDAPIQEDLESHKGVILLARAVGQAIQLSVDVARGDVRQLLVAEGGEPVGIQVTGVFRVGFRCYATLGIF